MADDLARDYANVGLELITRGGVVLGAELVFYTTAAGSRRSVKLRLRGDGSLLRPGGVALQWPAASGTLARLEDITAGTGGAILYELDTVAAGFNGSTTHFANLLPSEPDLSFAVMIFRKGAAGLFLTDASPSNAEFTLSGATNRDVDFGLAPPAGKANALYVPA